MQWTQQTLPLAHTHSSLLLPKKIPSWLRVMVYWKDSTSQSALLLGWLSTHPGDEMKSLAASRTATGTTTHPSPTNVLPGSLSLNLMQDINTGGAHVAAGDTVGCSLWTSVTGEHKPRVLPPYLPHCSRQLGTILSHAQGARPFEHEPQTALPLVSWEMNSSWEFMFSLTKWEMCTRSPATFPSQVSRLIWTDNWDFY